MNELNDTPQLRSKYFDATGLVSVGNAGHYRLFLHGYEHGRASMHADVTAEIERSPTRDELANWNAPNVWDRLKALK